MQALAGKRQGSPVQFIIGRGGFTRKSKEARAKSLAEAEARLRAGEKYASLEPEVVEQPEGMPEGMSEERPEEAKADLVMLKKAEVF